MKLSPEQWVYIRTRRDEIEKILKYKPENPFDTFALKMEWTQLNTLAKLSNIQVEADNKKLKVTA